MDVQMGYCGNCHEFTSPAENDRVDADWQDRAEQIRTVTAAIIPTLMTLNPSPTLPGELVPEGRKMLAEMPDVSLRIGDTVFYQPNGEPIAKPVKDALADINRIRESGAGDLDHHLTTPDDVDIHVHTSYLGVDVSESGPLPLIWETLVLVGGLLSHRAGPWRYATRAAAYRGHAEVLEALRPMASPEP